MSELGELIARVEASDAGSDDLDLAIWRAALPGERLADTEWRFSRSLDAALALVARVLPGCEYGIRGGPETGDTEAWARAFITRMEWPAKRDFIAEHETPALALLASMLKALASVGGGETVSQSQPSGEGSQANYSVPEAQNNGGGK